MSKNTTTIATLAAHLAEVKAQVAANEATVAENTKMLAAILAAVQGKTPVATPVAKVAEPKARQPRKASKAPVAKAKPAKVAKAVATPVEVRTVCKSTLVAFKAENAWAKGLSTLQVAEALVAGHAFEGAWTVGERTMNRVLTGSYDTPVAKVATPVVAAKVEPATPAKVVKAKAERAPEPEYGTDAWIAWARPTDDGAPRRADNGQVTPKREWRLRIDLAEAGMFDRYEIDALVDAEFRAVSA